MGLPASEYNTHSLRRSGASHLFTAGLPLHAIKVIGDWKSDCVFKYLKPTASCKIKMIQDKF